ncbi:DUF1450 domain-containing protein [Aquibacillus rhizosphaerae]|uniref:DUF1450 domain-containing protein n=1 Tax=Aquibacillus rhizosphaerae TaxID=3051431 RepID=A0ABT7L6Y4_9BACI|nr:DUF1450 domain-containing protein [Aquibacillus sp. LR5S19]MDL4841159.1 DUF1450 domain-containing protein [Aquibacillus sp. LR5S19]
MGILSKLIRNKPKTIECCSTNLDLFFTDEDLDLFDEYAQNNSLELKEMQCLDNCEECPISAYAVFDNKKVFADTPEQVLEKISKIRSN